MFYSWNNQTLTNAALGGKENRKVAKTLKAFQENKNFSNKNKITRAIYRSKKLLFFFIEKISFSVKNLLTIPQDILMTNNSSWIFWNIFLLSNALWYSEKRHYKSVYQPSMLSLQRWSSWNYKFFFFVLKILKIKRVQHLQVVWQMM